MFLELLRHKHCIIIVVLNLYKLIRFLNGCRLFKCYKSIWVVGLNITQIVDSLVDAEKTPQTSSIQTKIDDKTTSISAIGEVKSALSVLSSSLSTLVGKTSLAVSSNSTAVTATISDPSTATKLNSAMTISALATGQTLAFTGYSATTDVIGAGSLVLERGDWSSG